MPVLRGLSDGRPRRCLRQGDLHTTSVYGEIVTSDANGVMVVRNYLPVLATVRTSSTSCLEFRQVLVSLADPGITVLRVQDALRERRTKHIIVLPNNLSAKTLDTFANGHIQILRHRISG